MRPEFIGALIALISSLLAIIVVTFLANRRMNKERTLQKIEQQRRERNDELMPRIKEAQISVDTINSEILQIVERFYIAKRAQNEDENTYNTTINMLRDQLVNFQSLNEMDQLLTVVHAIGDEELINLAGEMNGVHNGLLGWIERLMSRNAHGVSFSMEDTQIIETARSDTLFNYGKFYRRLEKLRYGTWILVEIDVEDE
jgi:hypothetical protein